MSYKITVNKNIFLKEDTLIFYNFCIREASIKEKLNMQINYKSKNTSKEYYFYQPFKIKVFKLTIKKKDNYITFKETVDIYIGSQGYKIKTIILKKSKKIIKKDASSYEISDSKYKYYFYNSIKNGINSQEANIQLHNCLKFLKSFSMEYNKKLDYLININYYSRLDAVNNKARFKKPNRTNFYNKYGFDKYGFNRNWVNKDTKTKYDLNGFDHNGYHIITKLKFDLAGYDRDNFDRNHNKKINEIKAPLELEIKSKTIKESINELEKIEASLTSKKDRTFCTVCGIKGEEFLTETSIKSDVWSVAKEKVDYFNKIWLCPNHLLLFKKGLISFDKKGKIMISKKLTKEQRILWGLKPRLKLNISLEHLKYFEFHREKTFEGDI